MKKNIRKATSNDIEAAKRIFGEARAYMRRNGNSVQWVNGYPEKLIESDIDKSILYICEAEDGTALAVFALIVGEEDPCYVYIENGAWKNDLPYAVIHRAAVSEAARGTGAAKYIFNEVYKKYGNVRVDTHESNTPMRSFLTNLGYEECGIVYMEDNTPRVLPGYWHQLPLEEENLCKDSADRLYQRAQMLKKSFLKDFRQKKQHSIFQALRQKIFS